MRKQEIVNDILKYITEWERGSERKGNKTAMFCKIKHESHSTIFLCRFATNERQLASFVDNYMRHVCNVQRLRTCNFIKIRYQRQDIEFIVTLARFYTCWCMCLNLEQFRLWLVKCDVYSGFLFHSRVFFLFAVTSVFYYQQCFIYQLGTKWVDIFASSSGFYVSVSNENVKWIGWSVMRSKSRPRPRCPYHVNENVYFFEKSQDRFEWHSNPVYVFLKKIHFQCFSFFQKRARLTFISCSSPLCCWEFQKRACAASE